jgi:hypothetical protein
MSTQLFFMPLRFVLTLLFALPIAVALRAQEAPRLFDYWQYYSDAENALYKHYCDIAFEQLEDRKSAIEAVHTKADWVQRQELMRSKLQHLIGTFPERTPLNARITGKLKGDGFRVEKILFESMPDFPVTSALFIPDGVKKKAPAVLYCCGHTENGFRSETYQHVIINLVKKGFVVLAFDPVGQGERLQFYDPEEGKSPFGSTREHSYPGSKCFVAGYSPALYFVWDGIRAIDYLLTRVEVDPDRIGVTGRSGGGTQSSYIGAIDDRVLAAAPENFITDLEHLWKSRGPQDAEQNFLHATAMGFDHADLIELRAPKPTMLIATTRDIFSIEGTTNTYLEAKRAYEAFGAPEHLVMVQDDDGHASTRANREALYAFFQEHLSNPGTSVDEEVEGFEEGELHVTEQGNLYPYGNYEDLHSLNFRMAKQQLALLDEKRADPACMQRTLLSEIPLKSGADIPVVPRQRVYSGTTHIDNILMDGYLLRGTGDYWLPVLVYRPEGTPKAVVLHLSEDGKADQAMDLLLARNGYAVYAADVPGTGELGPGYLKGDAYVNGASFNQWYASMMTGGSITGLWTSDIGALARMAQGMAGGLSLSRWLIADGNLVPAALQASVLLQDHVDGVATIDGLISWEDLMATRKYESKYLMAAVPDVLRVYDLTDVLKAVDKPVFVHSPRRADGAVADGPYVQRVLFEGANPADRDLVDITTGPMEGLDLYGALLDWLEQRRQ